MGPDPYCESSPRYITTHVSIHNVHIHDDLLQYLQLIPHSRRIDFAILSYFRHDVVDVGVCSLQ